MKNNNCYTIEIENKWAKKEEVDKLLKNYYQLLKRIAEGNTNFNNISFIMGISNTCPRGAKTYYEHTGKKGRPKKIILGDKLPWHFHIYAISLSSDYNYLYLSTFSNECKRRLEKKGLKVKIGTNNSIQNAIEYLERQSQNIRKYGPYFKAQKPPQTISKN